MKYGFKSRINASRHDSSNRYPVGSGELELPLIGSTIGQRHGRTGCSTRVEFPLRKVYLVENLPIIPGRLDN